MIKYGYAKQYQYTNDSTLLVQVRIPSIHGPYNKKDAKGKIIRNYVEDDNLPYYPAVLMPHLPNEGEVVALVSTNDSNNYFLVVGLTGGNYYSGTTNL